YLFAMTADHGVCPLPEVAKSKGKDAGRVSPKMLTAKAEEFLQETFAKGKDRVAWIEEMDEPWLYLNRAVLKEQGLNQAKVETALADFLKKQPGMQAAYTRTQLG